jgi:hypothetical protein
MTGKFDEIRIRKEEIRKANLRKDIQNTEKGMEGVGMVRCGRCL